MPYAIDFENTSADIGSIRSSRFGLPPLQQLISQQLLCALFGYPSTPPLVGNSTEPFALSPWERARSASPKGRSLKKGCGSHYRKICIMPCNLSDIYRWRNCLPFQRAARIGQGGAPRSGVQNHE